ncbi:gluconokinase [Galactobacter valiniphilus]|nr:gluconokinase [Galactobacter valiniphilus]
MAPSTPFHVVVMGISGSGKSTLAEALSEELGWPFAEADEFHPAANIAKMSAGTPLTDEDRWPWLRSIAGWMSEHAEAGTGSVVTCSALKRSYRELLETAAGRVVFLEVDADPAVIERRMNEREGHFMPASLLPSQIATLEPLEADEDGAHLANTGSVEELEASALAALTRLLGADPHTLPGRNHASSGTPGRHRAQENPSNLNEEERA